MRSDAGEELDRILDEGLRAYAGEPRAGIEGRVMSRVRMEGKRRRSGWLRFASAVPIVASLVLVLWLRQSVPPPPPSLASFITPTAVAPITADFSRPAMPKARARHRVVRSEQFPTPSPLSEQERAMVWFASRQPDESRDMAAKQNQGEPEPIEIPELHIDPLAGSGGI